MTAVAIPVGVDSRDIEDWHFHEDGELSGIENWLIDNSIFSPGITRMIPRAEVTNSALALAFVNGEDPYLHSMIRGMEFWQLNRFKMFKLSETGEKEMNRLNIRWASDETYFQHMTEADFFRYEQGRNRRLFAEVRAYYIMANRQRLEVFDCSPERMFDNCFEI